jgi:hypothetical protein
MKHFISIFGVAEQGNLYKHIALKSLEDLLLTLGHPTEGSQAIEIAVQSLMYKHPILFYRVQEEGFENDAYLKGLEALKKQNLKSPLSAVALPGVSSQEVIDQAVAFCKKQGSILIMHQKDFYDYITR